MESKQDEYFDKFNESVGTNQDNQLCLTKISNFLEMKNISLRQFWQSNRNYASSKDIQKFCEFCGLRLGISEQISLKSQFFAHNQSVSIYEFCELIPYWRQNSQDRVASFLKERSEVLIQNLNQKNKINKRLSNSANPRRSMSKTQTKMTRPFSSAKTKNLIPNNTQKYLKKYKQKNELNEQKLAETIQKTKNEYEYGMLLKINELNEFNKNTKSTITYRAYKNAEGLIRVRVFNLDKIERELTLKQFESQYKINKKATKENKQWQRQTYGGSSKKEENKNIYSFSKNAKKEERQEELKNLLVNTVTLTNILREQIKIFKHRGIYGCENII